MTLLSRKTLDKAALIYDGDCGMCQRGAALARRFARPGLLETLPCQAPERRRRFPNMDESACLEAAQLVLSDGTVLSGEAALPHVMRRLRGARWFAGALELPGVSHASPYIYRWIAEHRHQISSYVFGKNGQTCRPGGSCGAP